ncbi:serine/threonine protein kinase [Listeria costaricensis]|uniref:serine/threonine protein kinase n=1 Tax=Listeria costaricensis TaxID=2026604 RepID=UPI0013C4461B|nr:serine/threonine-protein kinase [Listeria costaricensis]
MGNLTVAFLEDQYQILDILSDNEKKVELVKNKLTGQFAVKKHLPLNYLPILEKIKQISSQYLPKIEVICQTDTDLIVYEEFIHGTDLAKELTSVGPFPESRVLKVMTMLTAALGELHDQGIIHRDIKPSNIMISADGILKLIDFDASRKYQAQKERDTINLGTIGYAAPEQFGFAQTDMRSDVYSCGIVMWEMLTGQSLIDSEAANTPLKKIAFKAAAFDPAQRYQTITQLQMALAEQTTRPPVRQPKTPPAKATTIAEAEPNRLWYQHIPGFRTMKPWKIIPASLFYAVVIFYISGCIVEIFTKGPIGIITLLDFVILLLPFYIILTNIGHVWQKFPLLKSSNLLLKITGIFLYALLTFILFGIWAMFTK